MCENQVVALSHGIDVELRVVQNWDARHIVVARGWWCDTGDEVDVQQEVTLETGWCECQLLTSEGELADLDYCESPF